MLFLWSQNLGETDPKEVVIPLVVLILAAALLTLVLGLVFRDRRRGAIVASPFVVGVLMYGHGAHIAAALHLPALVVPVAWVGLMVVAVVAAIRLPRARLRTVDVALDRIAAILVVVTLVLIVPYQANVAVGGRTAERVEPLSSTTTAQKRDVYWLIFDRYGSDRSLKLKYGLDNDLTGWLSEQGCTVLPDSHANYIRTVLSLETTAQMADLADIAEDEGEQSSDLSVINQGLQDPLVARQFKALGYRYYHVGGSWGPTRIDSGADVNLTVPTIPGTGDFSDALYDASAFPSVARRLHIADDAGRERQFLYSGHGLDALQGLRDEPGPKFVMSHILLPHPPLVFDRDGSYMTGAKMRGLSGDEQYERQLAYTNSRIREIVGGLLALPEAQRPIIILQADEGPFPDTYEVQRRQDVDWAAGATEDELEQKYGILNAWCVPGGQDLGLDPKMTAINTFPTLFSRYFGIGYPTLPDRSFSSHDWFHPYDLTDITDRLPSLR